MSPRPEQAPRQETNQEQPIRLLEERAEHGKHDRKETIAEARAEQARNLEAARERVGELEETQQQEQLQSMQGKTEHTDFVFTPKDKQAAYKTTLQRIQRHLPKTQKAFSKFIHQPLVEKTSEVAGKTVFRPSLTLGATVGAFLGSSGVYLFAKHYGFRLAGSEFIFFGLAGALLGLFGELALYLIRKHILK